MKKLVIVMLALSSFIVSAHAQDTLKMKHREHRHREAMTLRSLNLSAEQKEQMSAVRESTKNQLAELNKNEELTVREYKARKQAILKAQKDQVNMVLTIEQKNQLAEIKAERKAERELSMAKRLDKMKTHLNLTDEQVTRMKADQEARRAKAEAIRQDPGLSQGEKKEKLMTLRQEQKNSLRQLLTPEQTRKMEELKKERLDKKSRK